MVNHRNKVVYGDVLVLHDASGQLYLQPTSFIIRLFLSKLRPAVSGCLRAFVVSRT